MADAGKDNSGIVFDPLSEAIEAFQRGEIVVITDDERRENEGDLVAAAEKLTPETINFMATHGRGLICVALDSARLRKLGLARMTTHGDGDPFKTAFMESVDARNGISTGISAYDRYETIRVLLDDETTQEDIVRPGHVFPLEAMEGGVLRRPGHTEAAVDLARLAGMKPGGAICEVVRDDGRMARLPELSILAKKHGLKMISVADLVAYRRRHETLVTREGEVALPTDYGTFRLFMYHSKLDQQDHLALVMGDLGEGDPPVVRLHSECLTGDVFNSQRCDCGAQLDTALKRIADEGRGILVYMRQEGRGIGLAEKLRAYALQDEGLDTVEANHQLGFEADLRDYGVGAQILVDLGVHSLRLLTNNPAKVADLKRYGLHVAERLSLVLPRTEHNERYLETKKNKLGHIL